jgi:hypothetical protein
MIPFPNVLAGIIIGIVTDTWFARLVIPFVWGIVFCVYASFFTSGRKDRFVAHQKSLNRKAKWGMSPIEAFYFVEYMTACFTSLIFSLISGAIKSVF